MKTTQESCARCGECCKKGGPALHLEDLELVRSGKLATSNLITIRKGELAFNPLTGKIQSVSVELVKIKGAGRQWDCCYHDATAGCTIYECRPQACRVLKCWDTRDVLTLVERNTLRRMDILPEGHCILPAIKESDRLFPCHDLQQIYQNRHAITTDMQTKLEKQAVDDVLFRTQIVAEFKLRLCDELFYFGRPFFQLLQSLGVGVSESPSGIKLRWERE